MKLKLSSKWKPLVGKWMRAGRGLNQVWIALFALVPWLRLFTSGVLLLLMEFTLHISVLELHCSLGSPLFEGCSTDLLRWGPSESWRIGSMDGWRALKLICKLEKKKYFFWHLLSLLTNWLVPIIINCGTESLAVTFCQGSLESRVLPVF